MTIATLVQMVAHLGLMSAKMGEKTFGIGALVGLGIATGVVGAIGGLIAGAAMMGAAAFEEGGMVEGKPGIGMMARVGEGGEPEVISPLSKLGTLVSVDNSGVSAEVSSLRDAGDRTNRRLDTLIANMEGYFGFGGKASREMGRSVVGGIESANRI